MSFDRDYHVIVKTEDQESIVCSYLKEMGFVNTGNKKSIKSGHNIVRVYVRAKKFQSLHQKCDGSIFTFEQFMDKYAVKTLKQKVEQVKKEIGYKYLSYMSIDLGHSHNYLGRVLRDGLESKAEARLIAKLDSFLNLHKKELTNDFEGKALHKHIDDAMMISKSEYESMKKEIDHKTQIAEKHADMRNKAELRVSELEKTAELRDNAISQQLLNSGNQVYKINEFESQVKSLQEKLNLSEQDSEKWQCDYWTVSRENIELINSKRAISIWLAVSILIIVAMLSFGVLHFNGVV